MLADHTTSSITVVGPYDVLCGRQKDAFNNLGNRRFRVTVDNHLSDYVNSPTRGGKTVVVQTIAELMKQIGGRFLKKQLSNTGEVFYTELTAGQACEKIGHALRDMAHANKKNKDGKSTEMTSLGRRKRAIQDVYSNGAAPSFCSGIPAQPTLPVAIAANSKSKGSTTTPSVSPSGQSQQAVYGTTIAPPMAIANKKSKYGETVPSMSSLGHGKHTFHGTTIDAGAAPSFSSGIPAHHPAPTLIRSSPDIAARNSMDDDPHTGGSTTDKTYPEAQKDALIAELREQVSAQRIEILQLRMQKQALEARLSRLPVVEK